MNIFQLQEENNTFQKKNSTLQQKTSTLQQENSFLQQENSTLQQLLNQVLCGVAVVVMYHYEVDVALCVV